MRSPTAPGSIGVPQPQLGTARKQHHPLAEEHSPVNRIVGYRLHGKIGWYVVAFYIELQQIERIRLDPKRSPRCRPAGLIAVANAERAARMIKFKPKGRPAINGCATGVRYFGLAILENQSAVVREVSPKTGAVSNHCGRIPGLQSGISDPCESVGSSDVRKLGVHAVKASKLMRAWDPHGPLDGIDADIVGDTYQVFHGTLFDLFEKARAFGLRPASNQDRCREQEPH